MVVLALSDTGIASELAGILPMWFWWIGAGTLWGIGAIFCVLALLDLLDQRYR